MTIKKRGSNTAPSAHLDDRMPRIATLSLTPETAKSMILLYRIFIYFAIPTKGVSYGKK